MKTKVTVGIECNEEEIRELVAFAHAASLTSSEATITIHCGAKELTVECVGVESWRYYHDQWVSKYGA